MTGRLNWNAALVILMLIGMGAGGYASFVSLQRGQETEVKEVGAFRDEFREYVKNQREDQKAIEGRVREVEIVLGNKLFHREGP